MTFEERELADPGELGALLKNDTKHWVDVCGLGDADILRAIGEILGMHRLVLEDVVNVPQRPKVEPYDEHRLMVTRMVRLRSESEIDAERVSILVGKDYVVTFQERKGDLFDPHPSTQGKGRDSNVGCGLSRLCIA